MSAKSGHPETSVRTLAHAVDSTSGAVVSRMPTSQTKRGTDSCPDCGTQLIFASCRTCSGTGRSLGFFKCKACNGAGEKTVCPNFLIHMRAQFDAQPSLATGHASTT